MVEHGLTLLIDVCRSCRLQEEQLPFFIALHISFSTTTAAFSSTPAAIQDLITRSEAQDVGEAALILKMKTRQIMTPARLTISKVFTEIRDKIAKVEGKNSQKTKLETMQKLIAATQRDEVKYLVRSFQAKLRVGINNATILTALAHAVVFAGVADRDDGGEISIALLLRSSLHSTFC